MEFVTASDPAPGQIVISEIHYHPASPTTAEMNAGFTDQDDFEFIELTNTTSSPLDLTNLSFTEGIHFDFSTLPAAERIIPAYGRILLARNPAGITERYGPAATVLAPYSGSLDNGGETITLSLHSATYLTLTYNDKFPWPESPDGDGPSLVLTCPIENIDHQNALNWQSSPTTNGSPLAPDTLPFSGDPDADDNSDGLTNFLHVALTNSAASPPKPCVGFNSTHATFSFQRNLFAHINYTVQHSTDLVNWADLDQSHLIEIAPSGNGQSTYTFQSPFPSSVTHAQFFRLSVSSP